MICGEVSREKPLIGRLTRIDKCINVERMSVFVMFCDQRMTAVVDSMCDFHFSAAWFHSHFHGDYEDLYWRRAKFKPVALFTACSFELADMTEWNHTQCSKFNRILWDVVKVYFTLPTFSTFVCVMSQRTEIPILWFCSAQSSHMMRGNSAGFIKQLIPSFTDQRPFLL